MREHEGAFNTQRYWEQRLQAHPGIEGVGHIGRSSQFVEQQYHTRIRQVELVLRHYKLDNLAGRSVS